MKVALFSGGGGKIGVQLGAGVEALRRDYFPDLMKGISAGALSALLLSTGDVNYAEELLLSLDTPDVLKKRRKITLGFRHLLHKVGLKKSLLSVYDNSPLTKTVYNALLGKKLLCDYACGVASYSPGYSLTYKEFTLTKGTTLYDSLLDDFLPYVIGSTCIPVVFEPQFKWTDYLYDGGLFHSVPLNETIYEEAVTSLTLFLCHPLKSPGIREPRDLLEVGGLTIDALLTNSFQKDLHHFKVINELARTNPGITYKDTPLRHIPMTIYAPEADLAPSLDFSNKRLVNDYYYGQSIVKGGGKLVGSAGEQPA